MPNFVLLLEPLRRHGRFSIFQDGSVSGLGFLNVGNLNCWMVNMHKRVKFGVDCLNRCGDMAVFRFFKMAAVRHVGF